MPANPCSVRSGLSTLTVLMALKLPRFIAAMMPRITTVKSSLFHESLRYEFGCTKKPMATILITISPQNSDKKIFSLLSTAFPLVVSSKPGSLLSIARNTQFSRISVITTLSNHGFRMSDTHNRRTGFSFRNTHSDFSGSSSNSTFLSATVGFTCFRDGPADPGPPCRLFGAGMVPPSAVPRQQRGSAQDTLIIPTGAGNRPPEAALQASLSLTKRARRIA
mmetsp:Transcript_3932/g.16001  ORF Transcript_3932/g.16001 Transcript_3932/m.16001 type:complete len:221 (+) Transcript_3932:6221-6883(+)